MLESAYMTEVTRSASAMVREPNAIHSGQTGFYQQSNLIYQKFVYYEIPIKNLNAHLKQFYCIEMIFFSSSLAHIQEVKNMNSIPF